MEHRVDVIGHQVGQLAALHVASSLGAILHSVSHPCIIASGTKQFCVTVGKAALFSLNASCVLAEPVFHRLLVAVGLEVVLVILGVTILAVKLILTVFFPLVSATRLLLILF
jgi:hypothetical protein